MRLCRVALALVPILFGVVKANASVNTTASPAPLGTHLSTGNRPGTFLSGPPNAGDEERFISIEDFVWGNKFAVLLAKIRQALWNHDVDSQLELKLAWWRVINKHPDFIYDKLELDKVDENILSNFWFHYWFKYVESYNEEHPTEKASFVKKLQEKYGDLGLAMMLELATREKDRLVQAISTILQSEQMKVWSRERKVTSSQLYNYLQPDPTHPTLLTGLAYDIWNVYFRKFRPGMSMPPFKQLLRAFGDVDLVPLLIAAKQSQGTATMAEELLRQLEDFWLKDRVLPTLIFNRLELDKVPFRLLDKPEFAVWKSYVTRFENEKETDATLVEVIKSRYDANSIQIIIKTALTKESKALAKKLEPKQAEWPPFAP